MPTHYVMKEMPDLQGKGERVTYPQWYCWDKVQPANWRNISPYGAAFLRGWSRASSASWRRQWRIQGAGLFGKDRRHRYVHSGAGDRRRQGA